MAQRKGAAEANMLAGISAFSTAFALFAHAHPQPEAGDRLRGLILDWQESTRRFWAFAAGRTGADFDANLKDGLTLSVLLIVTALAAKRGPPFQERGPRLLSLSFLEYFALYVLLTGLFVVIPFSRDSDQFDASSAVQFFLLLPVFAFAAAYAGRRRFFNCLWVAFASVGLLWLFNRLSAFPV